VVNSLDNAAGVPEVTVQTHKGKGSAVLKSRPTA